MSKPFAVTMIEFDAAHPLVVRIEPNAQGVWDMNVANVPFHSNPALNHQDKMLERIKKAGTGTLPAGYAALQGEWTGRPVVGGNPQPHFIKEQGHHFPIFVGAGETVRFECDYPFTISALRDTNVRIDKTSPPYPFKNWNPEAHSNAVPDLPPNPPYSVVGVADVNLTPQRFYKCTAHVTVGTDVYLIDPDVVG